MADAAELVDLVARRSGIVLAPQALGRRRMDEFVGRRLRALRLKRISEYIALLSHGEAAGEFSRLMATLTNPQTFFFRDQRQFAAISTIIEQMATTTSPRGRPLQLWSAGCATGEEPFSLAMLCNRLGIEARILGTDLNVDAIEIGRRGCYQSWSLRQLPDEYRRYFTKQGGEQVLAPEVRSQVELRIHNLVEDPPPVPGGAALKWDLVLCRNVFIYFDRPATQQAIRPIVRSIAPSGWFFLSAAESLHGLDVPLTVERIADSYGYRPITQQPDEAAATPSSRAFRGPAGPASFLAEQQASELMTRRQRRRTLLRSTEEVLRDPKWSFEHATRLMDDGDFARARRILGRLLVAFPTDVVARLTLGNLLLRSHAFDEALENYNTAHDIDPLRPEVHYFQGLVFRKLGDLERAISAFRRAVFLEPNFWCASFMLAGCYGRLAKWEPCAQNLTHTLNCVHSTPIEDLFISHTRHMPDATMNAHVVAELCRRQLQLQPAGD